MFLKLNSVPDLYLKSTPLYHTWLLFPFDSIGHSLQRPLNYQLVLDPERKTLTSIKYLFYTLCAIWYQKEACLVNSLLTLL